ncbi:hypothetical protein HS041_07170 [Planomonospora sp. ID67723]|uniref:helix-turn-helix transcriptional regulator n=1 Tax=Planomonospora sp. ID67723 TaxID=2738134 RepID=UPI0018C37F35|nr:hypothetical protein [Planomonospora sp. ID67723]MBG0827542.1 hypothetical protein [Planomonospora sp. ID67723]
MAGQPDFLTVAQVASLLKLSQPDTWKLVGQLGFPLPVRDEEGHDRWSQRAVEQWAGRRGHLMANPYKLKDLRPPPTPRPYLGLRIIEDYAVLSWDTEYGEICLVYPAHPSFYHKSSKILRLLSHAFSILLVGPDWGFTGKTLQEFSPADPEYSNLPSWAELKRALGYPAPFWPTALQDHDLMMRWVPGSPTIMGRAQNSLDEKLLLRLANAYQEDDPVSVTLRHFVSRIRYQAMKSAEWELSHWEKYEDFKDVTFPVKPIPEPEPSPVPSLEIRRQAWAKIGARTDELAAQCIDETKGWIDKKILSFSSVTQLIPGNSTIVDNWLESLCETPWCAEFVWLGASSDDILLRDPLTNLPAYRANDGRYFAAVPQKLPSTSPLQSIVLDKDVWICTYDGRTYLAPGGSDGITATWGYSGTGPSYLASLFNCLLDDIASSTFFIDSQRRQIPNGLLALAMEKHPDGTIFSRQDLVKIKQQYIE